MTTNLNNREISQKRGASGASNTEGVLVKDRDAAQLSALPFLLVLSEIRAHRLEERSDEGHFPRRTDNAMFAPLVATCKTRSISRRGR
jgi:hypothetical protein